MIRPKVFIELTPRWTSCLAPNIRLKIRSLSSDFRELFVQYTIPVTMCTPDLPCPRSGEGKMGHPSLYRKCMTKIQRCADKPINYSPQKIYVT